MEIGLQYCICGKELTETFTPVQYLSDLLSVLHTAIWYSVLKEFYASIKHAIELLMFSENCCAYARDSLMLAAMVN